MPSGEGRGASRASIALIAVMLFVLVFRLHELLPAQIRLIKPAVLAGPLALVLLFMRASPVDRLRVWKDPVVQGVSLYFLWAALSAPFALFRSLALESVEAMLPLLYIVFAFALIRADERSLDSMQRVFVALGGLLAAAALVVGHSAEGRLSVTSTLDPNDLGAMMSMVAPLAIGLAIRGRWYEKCLTIAVAALCAIVLVRTGSRGSTIGFVFGFSVFAIAVNKRFRLRSILLLAVAGSLGWFTAPADFRSRLLTIGNADQDYNTTSYFGRKQLWSRALGDAVHNPILGVGPGNFSIAEGNRLADAGQRGQWLVAHNSYIQAAAELGFVGAAIFVALLLRGLKTSAKWSGFSRKRHEMCRPELLAALSGLATSAFFLSLSYFWALFALLALLGLASRAFDHRSQRPKSIPA
jgi:O-antigen ligase